VRRLSYHSKKKKPRRDHVKRDPAEIRKIRPREGKKKAFHNPLTNQPSEKKNSQKERKKRELILCLCPVSISLREEKKKESFLEKEKGKKRST